MVVGVSVLELHLPAARSLKDKRRVVKALIERMYQRHRVSVAETGLHDLHQRAEVGIAVVGKSDSEVEFLLEDLRRLLDELPEAVVTRWEPQLLEG
ncbi:MAG: DUF503 domain-containing protein [Acidobacteriota bacterium]